MKLAVVGGGIGGMALAHSAASDGAEVTLYERRSELGGRHRRVPFGEIRWDLHTHVVKRRDRALLALVERLGLGTKLVWRKTSRGFADAAELHRVGESGTMLAKPLLGPLERSRLARALRRTADRTPLSERCGVGLWQSRCVPVLEARLGPAGASAPGEAARAQLSDFYGFGVDARAEEAGYVEGGAATIVSALRDAATRLGVTFRSGEEVIAVEGQGGARVSLRTDRSIDRHDRVVIDETPFVAQGGREGAEARSVRAGVVLRERLTPFFETTVRESAGSREGELSLRRIVEVTNLIESKYETDGNRLVLLQGTLPPKGALRDATDEEILAAFLKRGLASIFPGLDRADVVAFRIDHTDERARFPGGAALVRERRREPFTFIRSGFDPPERIGASVASAREVWSRISGNGAVAEA